METLLNVGLVILVLLMLPCGWRAWRGPKTGDRLLAIDLIVTLIAGLLVILALLNGQGMYLDVALAISALSFIGTVGISRFVSEGSMF
jgi:multisubunit Na+/H+ antiporter MnhF subunit